MLQACHHASKLEHQVVSSKTGVKSQKLPLHSSCEGRQDQWKLGQFASAYSCAMLPPWSNPRDLTAIEERWQPVIRHGRSELISESSAAAGHVYGLELEPFESVHDPQMRGCIPLTDILCYISTCSSSSCRAYGWATTANLYSGSRVRPKPSRVVNARSTKVKEAGKRNGWSRAIENMSSPIALTASLCSTCTALHT